MAAHCPPVVRVNNAGGACQRCVWRETLRRFHALGVCMDRGSGGTGGALPPVVRVNNAGGACQRCVWRETLRRFHALGVCMGRGSAAMAAHCPPVVRVNNAGGACQRCVWRETLRRFHAQWRVCGPRLVRQWRRIAHQWCALIMPVVLVSDVYGGKRSAVSTLLACVWAGVRRQWRRIALQWCALIMPAVLVSHVSGGKRSAVFTLVRRYCFEALWWRGFLPRGAVLRVVKCMQP